MDWIEGLFFQDDEIFVYGFFKVSYAHFYLYCWFHGSSFKGFSIVFLLPDWLKLNHLKSRTECGFSDIFLHHICSTVAEIIGMTNYAASFGAKKCFRKPHLKLLR